MNWLLRYFDFSEVSWWWILLVWLVVSTLVTSVTEGYWNQDTARYLDHHTRSWSQESSTRRYSALNRRRAPGWGGAIFSGFVAFLVWANYDSVGSLVPTLSKVGILLVGYIVVATTCWSLTLRWSLFCREEYDEPYNYEAARFLGYKDEYDRAVVWAKNWFFHTVIVPEERKDAWKAHWKTRAEQLGVTYRAPRWRDYKGLILEWTLMAPLSIQHTIWRLYIADGFWKLASLVGRLANLRSYMSDSSRNILD